MRSYLKQNKPLFFFKSHTNCIYIHTLFNAYKIFSSILTKVNCGKNISDFNIFLKAASLDLESQLPGYFYCFHQVKRPLSLTPCVQVVAQISGDKQSRGEPLKLGANGPFLVSS